MFVMEETQARSSQDSTACSTVNSHVFLGKSASLSEPQFPDLQNEGGGMEQQSQTGGP